MIFLSLSKRGASSLSQGGECKSEPAEKMPRKGSISNNGDDDGDVVMENKEAAKTVTIKKRKDVVDKKKRYRYLHVPMICCGVVTH